MPNGYQGGPKAELPRDIHGLDIDVEISKAEYDGRYYKGFIPVLGWLACNNESMEYVED